MPRKEKKYHFIYKTTNLLTGRYYIGMHSTDNLEDGYLGSGRRLKYSVNKYGKENHKREILEYLESRKELALREKEVITLDEIAKDECMNLCIGGEGGVGGKQGGLAYGKRLREDIEFYNLTINKKKEHFKRLRLEGKLGTPSRFANKTHSDETKKLMSERRKGNGQGETNSQYGTCWIMKDGVNKKINKDELNSYLNIGWIKGRKYK